MACYSPHELSLEESQGEELGSSFGLPSLILPGLGFPGSR